MEYIEEFCKDEFNRRKSFKYSIDEYVTTNGRCRIDYLLNMVGYDLYKLDYYKDDKLVKESYYKNGKLIKEVIYYE